MNMKKNDNLAEPEALLTACNAQKWPTGSREHSFYEKSRQQRRKKMEKQAEAEVVPSSS